MSHHSSKRQSSWAKHVMEVHSEAAGLMTLDVVQRFDMLAMTTAAMAGNAEALALYRLVHQVLDGILNAPVGTPRLCSTCCKPLSNGEFSIAIASPARGDARNGLALAVCDCCGGARAKVRVKATEALREIWPDARAVEITNPDGGHA